MKAEVALPSGGHHHLLRGSAWLLVAAAVQAGTGALFWLIAARLYPTGQVGQAAALFTSMLFVNWLTGMGLQVGAARYAGDDSTAAHVLFSWSVLYTAATSLVGTCIYLFLISRSAVHPLYSAGWLDGAAIFFALVVGSSLANLTDVRLMAARRWSWVMWRVALVGALRFPLLAVVPSAHRALWLFVLVAAPLALSGFVFTALLPMLVGVRYQLRPWPSHGGAAFHFSTVNYLSTLAHGAPFFTLPVIVLVNVSPTVNASFYVAWSIVAISISLPTMIAQALLVEGGKEGTTLPSQVRTALGLSAGLMTAATGMSVVLRPLIVTVYGSAYREAGRILPQLMLATIPWAVTITCLTVARLRHHHAATVIITIVAGAGVVLPALVIVPSRGVQGAADAWLAGNLLGAFGCHGRRRQRFGASGPHVSARVGYRIERSAHGRVEVLVAWATSTADIDGRRIMRRFKPTDGGRKGVECCSVKLNVNKTVGFEHLAKSSGCEEA